MAEIYERSKSSYYWTRFKDPKGNWIRRSTKIPQKAELREKAQLAANNMELKVWEGWHPNKEEEAQYPFDQLMIGFINEKNPCSGHIVNIETLNRYFGGSMMNDFGVQQVLNYKRQRKDEGISDATIRRELSVMSSAINYANAEWAWNLENPIKGRLPSPSKNRIRWISPDEAKRLVKEARFDMRRYPHLPDLIELGLSTGMRKQEILKLEVSRVNLNQGVFHLNPEHQKNSTYSTVPLNKTAKKVVLRRLSFLKEKAPQSNLMFPNLKLDPTGNTPLSDFKNGFQAACRRAGISDFRIHDMRHTFASWLVQAGVSLYVVKDLLRHKSITETEKYAHLAPKNKSESVDLLDRVLSGDAHYVAHCHEEEAGPIEILDKIPSISMS